MSVVTQIEEAGPCRLKVTIEVPAPAVEAEMGRVIAEFRGRANLPGFRRGKVPVQVIRRRYKKEIESETAERLLPRYWRQAEAEKNLEPLLPPTVEELKMEDGQPMTVVAVVETRPAIALGDLDHFDLPEENTDATEPEIDEAIAELRKSLALWQNVDRASTQGDLVVGKAVRHVVSTANPSDESADDVAVDDAAVDDAAEAGDDSRESRPIHIEIGGEDVNEELSLALTDKKPGQSAIFETQEGPEDARQSVRYEIEIVEVKEQALPEFDDEFAAKLGDFETADALRRVVIANVEQEKVEDLRQRRRQALLEQLRQRHPLTPPAGVVQQETERMMRLFLEQLSARGADLEKADLDFAALAEQMRPQAEVRVHDRLILDAVAKEKTLRLDESRFERVLAAIADNEGTNSLAVRQRLAEDGRLEPLRSQLLRDQAVAHLLGEDLSDDESADDEDDGTGETGTGDDGTGEEE